MSITPIPKLNAESEAYFWSLVNKEGGPDACWPWTGTRWGKQKGVVRYGMFAFNNDSFTAHRVAFSLTHGPIPDGMLVCHHCDNPPCCNPAHLFLGTQKDNLADRNRKGRQPVNPFSLRFGENHSKTFLTEDQVREIRRLYQPWKMSCSKLAKMFGMTKDGVYSIITGRTWKHVV